MEYAEISGPLTFNLLRTIRECRELFLSFNQYDRKLGVGRLYDDRFQMADKRSFWIKFKRHIFLVSNGGLRDRHVRMFSALLFAWG